MDLPDGLRHISAGKSWRAQVAVAEFLCVGVAHSDWSAQDIGGGKSRRAQMAVAEFLLGDGQSQDFGRKVLLVGGLRIWSRQKCTFGIIG